MDGGTWAIVSTSLVWFVLLAGRGLLTAAGMVDNAAAAVRIEDHRSRIIEVEGIENFRDVGGLQNMARGIVYRCGKTTQVTAAGREALQQLGMKWVVDLRYGLEIDKHGAADLSDIGCGRIHAPTMDPNKLAIPLRPNGKPWGTLDLGFVRLYMHFLDHGKESFKRVLLHVAETEGKEPTTFHCMSGKDRTGVLAMLLQMLAGVDDDMIIQDYALTEALLGDAGEHMRKNRPPSPAFDNVTDEELAKVASAKPETMLLLLIMFYKEWGDIETYCTKGLGIAKADVDKIRAILSSGPAKSRL